MTHKDRLSRSIFFHQFDTIRYALAVRRAQYTPSLPITDAHQSWSLEWPQILALAPTRCQRNVLLRTNYRRWQVAAFGKRRLKKMARMMRAISMKLES